MKIHARELREDNMLDSFDLGSTTLSKQSLFVNINERGLNV